MSQPQKMTWYHSDDVATGEDGVDFLCNIDDLKFDEIQIIALTLKSFPIILSSSFIPETYALEIFDRSRSPSDLNEEQ
jgi:hypothetical protein